MKRSMLILLAGALTWGLAACQKNTTTEPSSSEGQGLTQQNAQFLLELATQGDLVGIPKAPGEFLGGNSGKKAGLCSFTWSGNAQDQDGDDVPVDAYIEVDCDTTGVNGADTVHEVVRGRLRGVDADDSDPWVGRAELSGLGGTGNFYHFVEVRNAAGTFSSEEEVGGFVEATHQGNTFGENVNLNRVVHVSTPQGDTAVNLTYTGSVAFTPVDTTWNPGSGTDVDGTLDLSASWVVEGVGSLAVETPVPLEVRVNCHGGDPVAGTLRITDGTNTLEVTWFGCDQWTATFNGDSLQPAF